MNEPKVGWYKLIDKSGYTANFTANMRLFREIFHILDSENFVWVDEICNPSGAYHSNELVIDNDEWEYFEYVGGELPNNTAKSSDNITKEDLKDLRNFPESLIKIIKRNLKIDINDIKTGFRGEHLLSMDDNTLQSLHFSHTVFKSQQKVIDDFKDNTSTLLQSVENLIGLCE